MIDVTSGEQLLARVIERGLRVETITIWRGTTVEERRLRARRGVWPHELDAVPDSPWSRVWIRDACESHEHVEEYDLARAGRIRADAERLWYLLERMHPSPAAVDGVIAALLAAHGGAARDDSDRLATAYEVAHVLGVPIEQVRAMARRGDVRTVRRGARRYVPWSEVERLAALGDRSVRWIG